MFVQHFGNSHSQNPCAQSLFLHQICLSGFCGNGAVPVALAARLLGAFCPCQIRRQALKSGRASGVGRGFNVKRRASAARCLVFALDSLSKPKVLGYSNFDTSCVTHKRWQLRLYSACKFNSQLAKAFSVSFCIFRVTVNDN